MPLKHHFSDEYSVLTFATNKLAYLEFAFNCAQSILLHNDLKIYIVSDIDFKIPENFSNQIFIIPVKPGHRGMGIEMKLYIDEYLQTMYSLFIDSDCLCFGSLKELFNSCTANDVSVAGNLVPTASWCGAEFAESIEKNWGLKNIIRFNGALYYLKKTPLTKLIFDNAREIAKKYDYGFDRVRNKFINEEALLSIAMLLNQQTPVPDNGVFMTDLITDNRPAKINVLTGSRLLKNALPSSKKSRAWYPEKYAPLILHFGSGNINSYPYLSQKWLLTLHRFKVPVWLSSWMVNVFIHFPFRAYHFILGHDKN